MNLWWIQLTLKLAVLSSKFSTSGIQKLKKNINNNPQRSQYAYQCYMH